jgi:GntR family transcriptional regulator
MNSKEEPASQRVARALRDQITTGALIAGSKLPSERDLAEQYAVARTTASQAVKLLEDEGLVVRQQGRGNFVRKNRPLIRLGGDRYSRRYRGGPTPFRRECERVGSTPRVEVLSVERSVPPAEVAERLEVPIAETSVIQRSNLYFADDEPVQIVRTYIPWTVAEGTVLTERRQTGKDGIYGRLEEQGHIMTTGQEEVTARMPTAEEKSLLQLPGGTPIIEVLHTSYNQNGVPFETSRFTMRSDRNGLLYKITID